MEKDSYQYPENLMCYVQKIFLLIEEARQGALERQDPDFGDDAQVLGIRAYKNFVSAVESVKGAEGWEWLSAEAPNGRLTLQVDDKEHGRIVLRVWRADDPEQDAEQKRMMVAKECMASLELFPTPSGIIDRWGLVYQTDVRRLADTAYLIGYSSTTGEAIVHYEVPRTQIPGTVADMTKFPEPVEITSPKPQLKSSNTGSSDVREW